MIQHLCVTFCSHSQSFLVPDPVPEEFTSSVRDEKLASFRPCFFVDRAFKHARRDWGSPAPGVIWKDNEGLWHVDFMKTRSKVNSSIVLKIYWRKDKIIFDILLKVFEKTHTHNLIQTTSTIQPMSQILGAPEDESVQDGAALEFHHTKESRAAEASWRFSRLQDLHSTFASISECCTQHLSTSLRICSEPFSWKLNNPENVKITGLDECCPQVAAASHAIWTMERPRPRGLGLCQVFFLGEDKWNLKNGWLVKLTKSLKSSTI